MAYVYLGGTAKVDPATEMEFDGRCYVVDQGVDAAIADWLAGRTDVPATREMVAALGDQNAYKEKVWLARSLRVALHTRTHSALLYSASDVDLLDAEGLAGHPFLNRIGPDILDPGPGGGGDAEHDRDGVVRGGLEAP